MTKPIRKIVIVGGGSAGWITAGTLAAELVGRQVSITLVESPDVRTIGVGEGTWPTMRTTLQRIGLSERQFMLACDAGLKQGTCFKGWTDGSAGDVYYHPFSAPGGYSDHTLAKAWTAGHEPCSFAEYVGIQSTLCDNGLGPKQAQTPEFAGVANYAYHLDAGKFATLLQEHCTESLGVNHIRAHVESVCGAPDEDITGLRLRDGELIDGDLFIDCTGSAAMLFDQHYQVDFVDCRSTLFNDTALALQVPYASEQPLACQTNSTAQSAGWIWDIGLTSRRGVGYVYSSAHENDDRATEALRDYLVSTGAPDPDLEPRKLSFRPGHREKFWHKNCVAIGMSAGFIEPLEASALVLVELSARAVAENLPATEAEMPLVRDRFNKLFSYRWQRIIEFLKLHYVLSKRTDSDYWRDNRASGTIPETLQENLKLWKHRTPTEFDLPHAAEIFSAASFQYVLYGMGYATKLAEPAQRTARANAVPLQEKMRRELHRAMTVLPKHEQLVREMTAEPVAQ